MDKGFADGACNQLSFEMTMGSPILYSYMLSVAGDAVFAIAMFIGEKPELTEVVTYMGLAKLLPGMRWLITAPT